MLEREIPLFDPTLFDIDSNKKFTYSFHEISNFVTTLDQWIEEAPVCIAAIQLLNAVEQFLAATTTNKVFVEIRNTYRSTDLFENVFDMISNEFLIAEHEGKVFADDESEVMFIESAINYCYKVVLIRLIELKNCNDVFYTSYWSKSFLKEQIDARKHTLK